MLHILVILFVIGMLFNFFKVFFERGRNSNSQPRQTQKSLTPLYPRHVIDLYEQGFNYETAYQTGHVDIERAIELYRLSAEQGYPAAQYRLADIYAYGKEGVKVDLIQARFWVVKALEKDYPGAEVLYRYINAKEDLEQSRKKALENHWGNR